MKKKIFKIISDKNKERIDIFLSKKINYSRNKIKNIIKKKRVFINKKIVKKQNKKINIGDEILIYIYIKKKYIQKNKKIPLNKIYEDKYIIIINKKNNIIVHPGAGHKNDTLINKLAYCYPNIEKKIPRCGIVHRLDKNTTGLMIIAKNKKIYNILVDKIKKKKIIRIYKAIVIGKIKKSGKIKTNISRNKHKRTIMSINKKGKKSLTYFKIIEKFNYFTFIEIKLDTGRTHQIRLHMNYINFPIIGEKIYTKKNIISKNIDKKLYKKIKNFKRQALHASTLIFKHPISKKKIVINSPLPNDINNLLFNIRKFKNTNNN